MMRLGWLWGVAGLAATLGCALDSSGGAQTSGSGDDTTDGSTASDSASATTADATTQSSDTTMTEGTSTSDGTGPSTTDPTDPTATTGSSTTGPGSAVIEISDGPDFDFGALELNVAGSHTFTVSNSGDADATTLDGSLQPGFSFSGDAFPGTAGDCTETLAAGGSCAVEVVFAPRILGTTAGALSVTFDDPQGGGEESVGLLGFGFGTTGNLLLNPGGEDAGNPPPDWTELAGNWQTTTSLSRTGSRSIYGGDVGGGDGDYRIEQEIDFTPYIALVDDGGGLQVDFSGYARSFANNNDDYWIRLRFLDGVGADVGTVQTAQLDSTDWVLQELQNTTPAGTRSVEARLYCVRINGDACDAYFDDLLLTLTYPEP